MPGFKKLIYPNLNTSLANFSATYRCSPYILKTECVEETEEGERCVDESTITTNVDESVSVRSSLFIL